MGVYTKETRTFLEQKKKFRNCDQIQVSRVLKITLTVPLTFLYLKITKLKRG